MVKHLIFGHLNMSSFAKFNNYNVFLFKQNFFIMQLVINDQLLLIKLLVVNVSSLWDMFSDSFDCIHDKL